VCNKTQKITIKPKDRRVFGVTESGSSFGNRIEHGLKVHRRAGDHPKNVTGRRFPFERLVKSALQ
jgi:hypothetical protein